MDAIEDREMWVPQHLPLNVTEQLQVLAVCRAGWRAEHQERDYGPQSSIWLTSETPFALPASSKAKALPALLSGMLESFGIVERELSRASSGADTAWIYSRTSIDAIPAPISRIWRIEPASVRPGGVLE